MERLRRLGVTATRALATLDAALDVPEPTELQRDGAIQRFEYTFETVVRLGQRYLSVVEGVQANTPKLVMRKLASAGLLSDDEATDALRMVDERNLTVHAYIQAIAERVFDVLPARRALLRAIVERVGTRAEQQYSV